LAITASAGKTSATIQARRPSWADMVKHYPATNVSATELYVQRIRGDAAKKHDDPAYINTCAVRMSYALNRSGLRLGKAPSNGGTLEGGDGYNYWIRVQDVKGELMTRFKGADEELVLKLAPQSAITNPTIFNKAFMERWQQARDFMDMKLAGRNGIVVFETSGYLGATGHFTLWDGKAMELAFAPGHNDREIGSYYFWLTSTFVNPNGKTVLLQVARIKFWELK